MARIFYGVQGDGVGHVNRARIVAQNLPQAEFMFVGGGTVRDLKADGYPVVDIPLLDTLYHNNRVNVYGTAKQAIRVLARRRTVIKKVSETIHHFNPDIILTDYEYFTSMASRSLGRQCVSLDHQHILTHCVRHIPDQQYLSGLMAKMVIKRFFSKADHYLIVSFFELPPVDPETTEVFPAIVNHAITEQQPTQEDHVLVYLTSPTFHRLFLVIQKMDQRFKIYGFGAHPPRGNLVFKGRSREEFIKDLASCRYVIANGGHNVISEALYLGKPIFSFPIANHYEQFVNARFLSELGYGCYSIDLRTSALALESFEDRLDEYRARIKKCFFSGNERLMRRLKELIAYGRRV
jgi:uncharacterized protein (TIGR00661 family)